MSVGLRPLSWGGVSLVLSLASVVTLASCGGGEANSSIGATAEVTGSGGKAKTLSVPGAWVGRAPIYEVINGISVPPEPSPAINNSTIVGVDINANGVRDDVERFLAKSSDSPATFSAMLKYAQVYQLQISNIPPVDRGAALVVASKLMCAANQLLISKKLPQLNSVYVNTNARQAAFERFNTVLVGFSPEELLPCG